MSATVRNRLAKLEQAVRTGSEGLWVVTGHSEADFDVAIADLKRDRDAKASDLFVCLRRFGKAPAAAAF